MQERRQGAIAAFKERAREIVHKRLISCSDEYKGQGRYHTKLCDQLTADVADALYVAYEQGLGNPVKLS